MRAGWCSGPARCQRPGVGLVRNQAAERLDPGLHGRDFAHAAERLNQIPEIALTAMGALDPKDIPRLRNSSPAGHATPGRSTPTAPSASAPILAGITPNQHGVPRSHAGQDRPDPNRGPASRLPSNPM